MSKIGYPTKRLALEVFSIVFAVLLALALDSWQERMKVQKETQRALDAIAQDIQTYTFLGNAEKYNQKILDSLQKDIERYENGEEVIFRSYMARPEIKSLAWIAARENGIAARFERELFLDLAEVYVEFERLSAVLDYHSEFNLKSDPDMPAYTRARHVERHLKSSIFRQQELLKKSSMLLEKYKDHHFTEILDE